MLGLELDVTQNPYTLLFREEKLHQSQRFQEIWELPRGPILQKIQRSVTWKDQPIWVD
jgi:hypothetical protein